VSCPNWHILYYISTHVVLYAKKDIIVRYYRWNYIGLHAKKHIVIISWVIITWYLQDVGNYANVIWFSCGFPNHENHKNPITSKTHYNYKAQMSICSWFGQLK
jgi:hypothetical protein